jgi:hypothetical protein
MTGEGNLLVEAVGKHPDDVIRVARLLTELGATVVDETVVQGSHRRPLTNLDPRVPFGRRGRDTGRVTEPDRLDARPVRAARDRYRSCFYISGREIYKVTVDRRYIFKGCVRGDIRWLLE